MHTTLAVKCRSLSMVKDTLKINNHLSAFGQIWTTRISRVRLIATPKARIKAC
ncbi:Hypothetical protein I595_307 [Croceitalea dokdonensis DOKDO 023]|uniref:Uncharacterized protein n=1 Tax=Croceitalea dokdonensis DOKDO 023 TaxID=1300341 RepID=A0A0P7AII0_9FLAO|nr:Hypothetical protein I595_307 [Croceitalea dokdonensis DOKDO 023]